MQDARLAPPLLVELTGVRARPAQWGMLPARRARHDVLTAALDACGDDELAAAIDAVPVVGVGVGGDSRVIEVEGLPVFAKRIPITERELAHPRSTANFFGLPTSCQYGMHRLAGPGFGAWRELDANLTATEGVLAGETSAFALLHHWRVLPGRPAVAAEQDDVEAVVAQFEGDPAVRARFEELARADTSLVLFLEHLPSTLLETLEPDPVGSAETLERQLLDAVAFLRSHELLHMDGHFGNMRSDGEQLVLVDFGLATSPRFELSEPEHAFVARNIAHDADYAAMRLVNWLVTAVCGVTASTTAGLAARNDYVRRCAEGDIPGDVPAPVADILGRHAGAAARMNDFCWRLVDGDIHAQYSGASTR